MKSMQPKHKGLFQRCKHRQHFQLDVRQLNLHKLHMIQGWSRQCLERQLHLLHRLDLLLQLDQLRLEDLWLQLRQ